MGFFVLPSPEQVEDNIHILRRLHGADLVDPIVEVALSPEQVALLERLGLREHPDAHVRMSSISPMILTPKAEAALLEVTVPGGPLDPAHLGGDVVWVQAIRATLACDAAGASKLARKLYAHLTRLAWDADEEGAVHSVLFAMSAYSVAFVEHLRGRPHEARQWAREADTHVSHEYPPELSVLTFLRACRLWVGETGRSRKKPELPLAYVCWVPGQGRDALRVDTRMAVGERPGGLLWSP